MIYKTASAFRQALEDRLLAQSHQTDVSLVRLRKLIAFDRFLARLWHARPDDWLLKGGLVLQLRMGDRARTTKDIDVLLTTPRDEVNFALHAVTRYQLDDWFSFVIRSDADALPGPGEGGVRFFATARLDGRPFESFHIDVGIGDLVIEAAENLSTPPLLAFAGIPPVTIPCYPLSQHLAEKVHAYVQPRASGSNTRVKDLVDIVLIAEDLSVGAEELGTALRATFASQGDGDPPTSLPAPPASWALPFRRLAEEVALGSATLPAAHQAAQRFLDPALSGVARGKWSPNDQSWR